VLDEGSAIVHCELSLPTLSFGLSPGAQFLFGGTIMSEFDEIGSAEGAGSASQINFNDVGDLIVRNGMTASLSPDLTRPSDRLPRLELRREDPAEAERNRRFATVADELAQGQMTGNFFNLIRSEFSRGEGAAVEAAIGRLNRSLANNGVGAELRLTELSAQQQQDVQQRAQREGRPAPQYMRHLSIVDPANNAVLGGPFTLILGRRPRP
jgi:hypothetical protein